MSQQGAQPVSAERAEAIIFGKLAERPNARFLVIRKPLQLLVGTPENSRVYRMHVLSVYPEALTGPYYNGALHYETINAFDGHFISDLDAMPSGRSEFKDKIPLLEAHVFTLAITAPSRRIPVRQGRIAAIETMRSAPVRPGKRVVLFSPDIILVANFDKEDRLLYFQTGSNWHSLAPDQALLFSLMQLFS